MRKIIVTVAPVCHVGKEIPAECKNPLTPEEIAEDTINCFKAGACEVHLHTRDLRYWATRLKETNTVPEMELFDLSHVECATRLADEGYLQRPLHYNFCIGPGNSSNLSATGRNLAMLCSLMEPGCS